MTSALRPALARLTPAEKLQLVGDLWDELAATGIELPLTAAQQAELRAEREAIRRTPGEGSTWSAVKARIRQTK
jgi:putative addiction module component (TIGR02574 family)